MGSKVEHPFKIEVWEGNKIHEVTTSAPEGAGFWPSPA